MLKYRIITAVIMLLLVIFGIFYLPNLIFTILTALIVGWCAWEWAALIAIQHPLKKAGYALLAIASLGLTFLLPAFLWLCLAILLWLWAMAAVICYAKNKSGLLLDIPIVKGIFGILVMIPFWLALNLLRLTNEGPGFLLFVLVLIWAVDTGAYFSGRLLGRRQLIPRVSPKKTWAGFWGGLFACAVVAVIYVLWRGYPLQGGSELVGLALITGFAAVIGDLFESMLKRQADIKDSGSLLPGHGGILDRLDSTLAALPIFAFGLVLLG